MGRLPRLPLTVFDRTGVVGYQGLTGDHLAYCGLATDRQKRANDIVRAHDALTVSRVNRRNFTLADALRPAPNFAVGGWALVYNSVSTIRQDVKANTDAKVLKAKLALNWTGLYKILEVGPFSAAETPEGSPLGSNLLYSDLPSDLPGSDARRRVAIEHCKRCANPQDSGDIPKYLPAGMTQYVLNKFSNKSPPYHVTQDDVSIPLQRLEVEQITGHQSVRGRGGVIAVLYKTHWAGLSEPSWEREMNLYLSRSRTLRYWAETPDQNRQNNRLYRRMRIGAAQRELSRNNGERFLAPGYPCVPRANWLRRYHGTVLLQGAHFWYRGDDGLCWLGKISASITEDKVYLVSFLDDPGPIKLPLPRRATRIRREPYEALGACKFTLPVRVLGESNVTLRISRRSRGQLTFKPPPLLDSSSFYRVMRFEFCLWVVRNVLRVFVGFWGGSFFFSFFVSCRAPCSVPGQGAGKTPLSEAQGCRFFVVVQVRPADALLSPEPRGDQGTLFARNVVQGYVRACVSSFTFLYVVFALNCFLAKHFPPSRGCRFCHLPSRVFIVSSASPQPCRWPAGGFSHDLSLVLAPVFPSMSTRARFAIVPFLWLVCRRAFPAPLATPAVCGRF